MFWLLIGRKFAQESSKEVLCHHIMTVKLPFHLLECVVENSDKLLGAVVFNMPYVLNKVRRQVNDPNFQKKLRDLIIDMVTCHVSPRVLKDEFQLTPSTLLRHILQVQKLSIYEDWLHELTKQEIEELYMLCLRSVSKANENIMYFHESGIYVPVRLLPASYFVNCIDGFYDSLKYIRSPHITKEHVMLAVHHRRLDILHTMNIITQGELKRSYKYDDEIYFQVIRIDYIEVLRWFHSACVCNSRMERCIFSPSLYHHAKYLGRIEIGNYLERETRCLYRVFNEEYDYTESFLHEREINRMDRPYPTWRHWY